MQYETPAIERIDAYLSERGMSDRQLSLALSRDHKMIRRIREGRANIRTINRVLAFIDGKREGEAA